MSSYQRGRVTWIFQPQIRVQPYNNTFIILQSRDVSNWKLGDDALQSCPGLWVHPEIAVLWLKHIFHEDINTQLRNTDHIINQNCLIWGKKVPLTTVAWAFFTSSSTRSNSSLANTWKSETLWGFLAQLWQVWSQWVICSFDLCSHSKRSIWTHFAFSRSEMISNTFNAHQFFHAVPGVDGAGVVGRWLWKPGHVSVDHADLQPVVHFICNRCCNVLPCLLVKCPRKTWTCQNPLLTYWKLTWNAEFFWDLFHFVLDAQGAVNVCLAVSYLERTTYTPDIFVHITHQEIFNASGKVGPVHIWLRLTYLFIQVIDKPHSGCIWLQNSVALQTKDIALTLQSISKDVNRFQRKFRNCGALNTKLSAKRQWEDVRLRHSVPAQQLQLSVAPSCLWWTGPCSQAELQDRIQNTMPRSPQQVTLQFHQWDLGLRLYTKDIPKCVKQPLACCISSFASGNNVCVCHRYCSSGSLVLPG